MKHLTEFSQEAPVLCRGTLWKPISGLAALLLLTAWLATTALSAETFTAEVIGITDGDTVKVLQTIPCGDPVCDTEKKQHKIRLAEIDTPERGQPFGTQAKQMLSDLVFGKKVTVQVIDTDRYGRLVAHIYVDRLWVNGEMVLRGGAWVYRKYARTEEIYTLEKRAREEGWGLWALTESQRIPPWEWRKRK